MRSNKKNRGIAPDRALGFGIPITKKRLHLHNNSKTKPVPQKPIGFKPWKPTTDDAIVLTKEAEVNILSEEEKKALEAVKLVFDTMKPWNPDHE